ncbi:hypothetical protein BWP39_05450 [Paraburkholderia acidicola]|uniref:Uncharacterized protein n=1 Tax=Paraburkholderia acidicola TaxID=1912599 RepID=A0A2A4F5I3_9BURK|nr:hypothetical protein [Paraburkholderia acidicola]PCE27952.1 hypothetical protein BWP39_05450 [Paraburkholderia acidicola]
MALTRQETRVTAILVATVALIFWLAILVRDAYPGPNVPVLWINIAGALPAAMATAWWARDWRKPLANPLIHALRSLLPGAMVGFLVVNLTLDTLVRFTASQRHTGWASYEVTQGWKNCHFGVVFEDPVLRVPLRVCGSRWNLPDTPNAGVLRITEVGGPYGVVLQQVTTGSESLR